jgi:hypothetical protein
MDPLNDLNALSHGVGALPDQKNTPTQSSSPANTSPLGSPKGQLGDTPSQQSKQSIAGNGDVSNELTDAQMQQYLAFLQMEGKTIQSQLPSKFQVVTSSKLSTQDSPFPFPQRFSNSPLAASPGSSSIPPSINSAGSLPSQGSSLFSNAISTGASGYNSSTISFNQLSCSNDEVSNLNQGSLSSRADGGNDSQSIHSRNQSISNFSDVNMVNMASSQQDCTTIPSNLRPSAERTLRSPSDSSSLSNKFLIASNPSTPKSIPKNLSATPPIQQQQTTFLGYPTQNAQSLQFAPRADYQSSDLNSLRKENQHVRTPIVSPHLNVSTMMELQQGKLLYILMQQRLLLHRDSSRVSPILLANSIL